MKKNLLLLLLLYCAIGCIRKDEDAPLPYNLSKDGNSKMSIKVYNSNEVFYSKQINCQYVLNSYFATSNSVKKLDGFDMIYMRRENFENNNAGGYFSLNLSRIKPQMVFTINPSSFLMYIRENNSRIELSSFYSELISDTLINFNFEDKTGKLSGFYKATFKRSLSESSREQFIDLAIEVDGILPNKE